MNTEIALLKLQTNLSVFNRILMHLEFQENGVKLPAFSKTDIKPYWIHFYKLSPQEIEILMAQTILRLNGEPDDIEAIKNFAESISSDPEAFYAEFINDDFTKDQEAEYLNEFNSLDDDEQTKVLEDQILLFSLAMALSFNYISVMMFSLTLKELLFSKTRPSHQDIYSAVKVDKCLLFHEKVQQEITKAQFDGDDIFFHKLASSVNHLKFKTDRKTPRAYYAYSILEHEGYIVDGHIQKCTAKELLDIINKAGFYHPNEPTNSEKKFKSRLKKYYEYKKYRLTPN